MFLPETIPQTLRQSTGHFFPQITQIYAEMIDLMMCPLKGLEECQGPGDPVRLLIELDDSGGNNPQILRKSARSAGHFFRNSDGKPDQQHQNKVLEMYAEIPQ